jgi:glycosyltransferase involved in cell wall biosynthesis
VSVRLSIAFLSHLASPHAPTGAEHSLALLALAMHDRGHRVAVVAPGDWALRERLRSGGVDVEVIPSRACWMAYWEPRPWPVALAKWASCVRPQRSVSRLADFLRRWAPDVVHVNCLPHLPGAAAGARSGTPVVWHLREILPAGRRRRWLAGRVARHATAVVAVSEAVARWVREEGLGHRLHVVPNGVEPPATVPDAGRARAALGLRDDGVVIGLFGQLVAHKGALSFIEAARRALGSDPELRFVLAGAGPAAFRRRCADAIDRADRGGRIRLLPPRPSGDELIAATDVVSLATTTPDPFPRAVLEAMAAGRPVAAFDSGGTGEMVTDGETGVLVPTGDVDALAEAFARLGRDRPLRERMGRAAAARARDRFSLERHVDRMESLLTGVARPAAGCGS